MLSAAAAAPSGLGLYGGYHGPQAIPHVLPSGHLADTHEVAAAKAEHFSAVAKAASHGGYAGGYGHENAGAYGHAGVYAGAAHGGHGDLR